MQDTVTLMECTESSMEVEQGRAYIDQLYSNKPNVCLEAARELKFRTVGNLKMKMSIIEQGVVTRLMQILKAPDSSEELKMEVVVIMNSIAKGDVKQAEALVKAGLVPVLWEHLDGGSTNSEFTQRVLCCLRSIYQQGCVPTPPPWSHRLLTTLIQYGYAPTLNQECVANIIAHACKNKEQQQQLVEAGVGDLIVEMLASAHKKIQLPSLFCLASLCYQNENVSKQLKGLSYNGKDVPSLVVDLMGRDVPDEIQLAGATCMVYLHRSGALRATDKRITLKTIQCLVRLCKKEFCIVERVEAAHQLAYLTEVDVTLQATASITDHLPNILAEYLKYTVDKPRYDPSKLRWPLSERNYRDTKIWPELMKIAAFQAFTSITANDESIRKVVLELDGLMSCLVVTLHKGTLQEQMAAVRCLHSLSRSVQTLRTGFQDHIIWKPLMDIIKDSTNEEFITVACSSLCNLLLEFSPSKEYILDHGAIDILCSLTRRHRQSLRLNTVWALMNAAFQADIKTKTTIIRQLGTDQIFNLLGDCDVNVIMKTLGLLRNLLSTTSHIDQIMDSHGKEIVQGIIMVLENEHSGDVKEQALCILANIADGVEAKNSIMSNEDILKKLMNYMVMPNVKLQMAATYCISNLVAGNQNVDPSIVNRLEKLKAMGIEKILESILSTPDANLYDKVKIALGYFKGIWQ